MGNQKVLLFGGYGVFGSRIAADLLQHTDAQVAIAGRNLAKAEALCARLGSRTIPLACDLRDTSAVDRAVREAAVVIVAAGPFQGLPLTALEAAAAHRVHYIDLADARSYRHKVESRRGAIQEAGIVALSGLSTVSGISAILARWGAEHVGGAERVDVALSPGNRNPRGAGTITSVLTSVGRPLQVWQGGRWTRVVGWTGREQVSFPTPVGRRPVYWVDGPDYDVLPSELGCRDVTFKAGLELDLLNRTLGLLGLLRRRLPGLELERYARLLIRFSLLLAPLGTERGALRVEVRHGRRRWECAVVRERAGPIVAATPAAVAAARLLRGEMVERGLIPLSRWIAAPLLVKELETRGVRVVPRSGPPVTRGQNTDDFSDSAPRHSDGGQASPVPSPIKGEGG